MTDSTVIQILTDALLVAGKLAAPVLVTALVVGFAIALLQSITQLQEMTISFVPKVIAVGIALVVTGRWMLHEITGFTTALWESIPTLLQGG